MVASGGRQRGGGFKMRRICAKRRGGIRFLLAFSMGGEKVLKKI